MTWAQVYDGVAAYSHATSNASTPNGFVFKARFRILSLPSGNGQIHIGIGTGTEQIGIGGQANGQFRIQVRNTGVNLAVSIVLNQWYDFEMSQPAGAGFRAITSFLDAVQVDTRGKPSPVIGGHPLFIGANTALNSFLECDIETIQYTELTTGSDDGLWDATASSHAAGTPILNDTINSNNTTGVNMATGGTVANGGVWLDLGGSGISIVGDTALFDFNALAGAVDLTGEILVTGSTASFDYVAISGSVDLTGQLLIIGDTANFDYAALPGGVDLAGEIIVTGSTANFDYTGENGIVELGAVINVVGQTASFDFSGVDAEVLLTGEITIIGDTATFNYQALSGLVVIGQGQKIGTVTAGFAESTIGVQYKQNTITVNFGE
jgi:hypothetical protein